MQLHLLVSILVVIVLAIVPVNGESGQDGKELLGVSARKHVYVRACVCIAYFCLHWLNTHKLYRMNNTANSVKQGVDYSLVYNARINVMPDYHRYGDLPTISHLLQLGKEE